MYVSPGVFIAWYLYIIPEHCISIYAENITQITKKGSRKMFSKQNNHRNLESKQQLQSRSFFLIFSNIR